ncbi:hypothetical protein PBI_RHYNO_73 [Mycobacterium phage RhynO]|uniref:hypothetical protein n=1 Tax=Mycobacterium phage RhynO TaxID=1458846 RepID=UPI0003F21395|nr:hypothetical protein CG97_gp09 [Mycobacterium phage RhynO]AHJ88731.1 hypothetical protein PBI_RHYNO_73 [Mycobacterium phage RhynO]
MYADETPILESVFVDLAPDREDIRDLAEHRQSDDALLGFEWSALDWDNLQLLAEIDWEGIDK